MASERVAFLGLGNIGRGMSKNIALKGPQTDLFLWNRTASKATAFADTLPPNKATVASSIPAAVQQATIIFTCVGDDPALEQIISTVLNDKETNPDLSSKTFVDCSTIHPDTTRRIHDNLAARGASFVACPVFGVPAVAEAGQLIVVPAGNPEAIERIRPFLDGVVSRVTIDLGGPDVGRASMLKLMGNTFILNTVETLAEGFTAAEKIGIGAEAYQEWVHAMFPGPFSKYADRMVSGDYHQREEPLFAVDLARKDLGHAKNLAEASGMRLRSGEITDKYLQDVKAERGEKGDVAAIYGAVRKDAGLPFANSQ